MKNKLHAKIPTRIDLAGGTLDISPLYHILEKKMTINLAVGVYARVELDVGTKDFQLCSEDQKITVEGSFEEICSSPKLPLLSLYAKQLWNSKLPCFHLRTSAESPAGAGLGGSSALSVAVCGIIAKAREKIDGFKFESDDHFIRYVQDTETKLIRVPTGCQDYWGAFKGGYNIIKFPPGKTLVENHPYSICNLSDFLTLCFSGKSRASGINNWEVFKKAFDGDENIISSLNEIGSITEQLATSLLKGDLDGALSLSKKEWQARTHLWPKIETPETQKLDKRIRCR